LPSKDGSQLVQGIGSSLVPAFWLNHEMRVLIILENIAVNPEEGVWEEILQ